jgi:ABC-type transport system involved in cytochrome bd biosynthesis fused ATPase/permease subunit
MFNFQQSLRGSIVPQVSAVPIDQAVPKKFNSVFNLKLAQIFSNLILASHPTFFRPIRDLLTFSHPTPLFKGTARP